jgi:hypothetical protein
VEFFNNGFGSKEVKTMHLCFFCLYLYHLSHFGGWAFIYQHAEVTSREFRIG